MGLSVWWCDVRLLPKKTTERKKINQQNQRIAVEWAFECRGGKKAAATAPTAPQFQSHSFWLVYGVRKQQPK